MRFSRPVLVFLMAAFFTQQAVTQIPNSADPAAPNQPRSSSPRPHRGTASGQRV